ncbi:hypothetical protein NHJ13734_002883 [Beauveria thailandica]
MAHKRGESDDSSFYGKPYDSVLPNNWIMKHQEQPGWAQPCTLPAHPAAALHNPYAGVPFAWQLTETVDNFLARLPPSQTAQTPETPWIYICNPYIPRVAKSDGLGQTSKDNEDEGPEQEGARLDVVIEGGMERLELLGTFLREVPNFGKPPSTTERERNKERSQATLDILHLAHIGKVRAGKVRIPFGAAVSLLTFALAVDHILQCFGRE